MEILATMITKEKIKKEIDELSIVEMEKSYLYLSPLKKSKKKKLSLRSLKLAGKLDKKKVRPIAYTQRIENT